MSIGFDKLAPWYGILERLLFGPRLQEMRCAYLKKLSGASNILLIGEGTGLFLERLLKFNQEAKVTVVESSFRMIDRSRNRVASEDSCRVTFHQTTFAEFESVQRFDALCTFFFWDCFEEHQLGAMLPALSEFTNPEGFWIDVDFFERLENSQKINLSHFLLIRTLYGFFGLATGIEARHVVEIEPMANKNGFLWPKVEWPKIFQLGHEFFVREFNQPVLYNLDRKNRSGKISGSPVFRAGRI